VAELTAPTRKPPQPSLAAGDPIGRIHFIAGEIGGLPFYVDNIEIIDRASDTGAVR
jgi:hypothetical protein